MTRLSAARTLVLREYLSLRDIPVDEIKEYLRERGDGVKVADPGLLRRPADVQNVFDDVRDSTRYIRFAGGGNMRDRVHN